MQHSIAARHAAWPARFVHPSSRARERQLGLRPSTAFTAASARRTVLRRPDVGPLTARARPVARPHDRPGPPGPQRPTRARVRDAVDERHAGRRSAALLRGAGVARLKQAVATSAGGIVIRFVEGSPQLVVGKRKRERDGVTWTLPKGTPNARRDDRGDRPPRGRARRPASTSASSAAFDSIEYWFVQGRTRIHKTVHYFLMVPTGGDLGRHDHEFDEVRWIGFDEAPSLLTFETERALVARARRRPRPTAPSRSRPGRRRGAPHDRARADRPDADAAARPPRGAGREDRRVRGLADADPVRAASSRSTGPSARRPGLFDLSHMGELVVEGPEAGAALAGALVTDPPSLAVGRAHYSMICAPDGGILDDLIVYRLAEDRFMVVANASNAKVVSRRARRAARRVQGGARRPVARDRPRRRSRARAASTSSGRSPTSTSTRSATTASPRATSPGVHAQVARTGYTGEDGFELFVDVKSAGEVWDRVLEAGRPHGMVPVGLGARDTLRLEAGMPLYGNELDRRTNPYQAGLGRVVKLGKAGDFVGRAALEKVAKDGVDRRLVGLALRGRGHRPPRLPGPRRGRRRPASSRRARCRRRWARRSRWRTSLPPMPNPVRCWPSRSAGPRSPPRSCRCRSTRRPT